MAVTVAGWMQIAVFIALLTAITPPLGAYLVHVFAGERVLLSRAFDPVERGLLRLVAADREPQDWKEYGRSVLVFSAVCLVAAYAILRTQSVHPWDHGIESSLPWDVAFNTAVSFVSNTSWQFYAGETSLTTFSQMTAWRRHAASATSGSTWSAACSTSCSRSASPARC